MYGKIDEILGVRVKMKNRKSIKVPPEVMKANLILIADHYGRDMGAAEVALRTGMSVSTIKSYASHLRKRGINIPRIPHVRKAVGRYRMFDEVASELKKRDGR